MSLDRVDIKSKVVSIFLSDENLTKKATLNSLAAGLDYVARLLVGFVLMPVILTGLGGFYFGVWQFLLRVIGYISPASGRPSQALKWILANAQTSTDYDNKRRYVGSAIVVWLIFLPLMAILGSLLAWFVPGWINAPLIYYWPIRVAIVVLVVNLVLTSMAAIPQSVLEGENLGYKRMGLSAVLVLLGGGFTWLSMFLKTGIIGLAVALIGGTVLSGLFYYVVVRTYAPWYAISRPSITDIRKFLGLSWWFLGWNLVLNLMMASDVVVLGLLDSVELVGDYTLTKYAPETMISIIATLAFGISPGLGGIIGSGNYEKAARVRAEIMAITWLLVTAFGSTVLLWNHAFLSLWVGVEHYVGTIQCLLIVIVVIQFVLIRNDSFVIDMTLKLSRKVIIGFISVSFSILIAGILVGYYKLGIVGLCVGIIIGRIILSVYYPVLVGRFLQVPFLTQLKVGLRPATVSLFLFFVTTLLGTESTLNRWILISGWIGLGFGVGVTFLISLGVAFLMGLSADHKNKILRRIKVVMNLGHQ
jgi:O-antigen/teichoic acid export membrane protein